MSTGQPTISVCMPTCNQARYLAEAIESVLRQTRQDFELVIYDDASSDDTPQIARLFSDERVRYFRQPSTVGIAENRNSCLQVATGTYVAWLDSDDTYHREMLATQSDILDIQDDVSFVHGAFEVVDPAGRHLPRWPVAFAEDTVETSAEAFAELSVCNYVTTPTVMVRRSCHDRAGPFAAEIGRSSTDWHMWLRLACLGDVAFTATPVACYRQHPESISAVTAKQGERLRCDERVLERIFSTCGERVASATHLERRAKAALAARFLLCSGERFVAGDRTTAAELGRHALEVAPWLNNGPAAFEFLKSIEMNREYDNFRMSRSLLARLQREFRDSRYGQQLAKQIIDNAQWHETLRAIARTIDRVLPEDVIVATVDKADPTLLALCRRRGHHFPDWRLVPPGYPVDSDAAIAHLEQLQAFGVSYIVFPCTAFWWLEHYRGLKAYLSQTGTKLWDDERVVVYELSRCDSCLSTKSSSAELSANTKSLRLSETEASCCDNR